MKHSHLIAVTIFIALLSQLCLCSAGETRGEARQWDVHELKFHLDEPIDGSYGVEFSATLRHADGDSLTVPGFFNGGSDFVVRFTPPKAGVWKYETHGSVAELDGKSGELHVGSAREGRRGGVTRDPGNVRNFVYQDGGGYYPIAIEADWLFALDADNAQDIPNTRRFVDAIASNGFNQVVMNVFAYDVKWPKDERLDKRYDYGSPSMFPFGGTNGEPDHSRLNVEYFQRLDRVIDYLDEKGIVAHLMIYVWNKRVNWPEAGSEADNRYFDYVVRRYQAYPNLIWDISKEALGYGHNDVGYITDRIDRLKKIDAYGRLVTVHDYGYCARFPQKLDFISVQIWSSELYSVMSKIASQFAKQPILNIEHGGYERGPYVVFEGSYTSPEVCLERAYQCVFAGTYPTHYWQGAAWNVFFADIDAMAPEDRPRLHYYKHMREFVERFDLAQLKAGDKKSNSGFCLHNGDDLFIYYVPKENINIGVSVPKKHAGAQMTGTWWNPHTGQYSDPIEKAITQWPGFDKPENDHFDILIVQVQTQEGATN